MRTEADSTKLLVEAVQGKREILLRAYRSWLSHADLEEAMGQTEFELVRMVKRDFRFNCLAHAQHTLEVKFQSRIFDRRRQLQGRAAMERVFNEYLSFGDPSEWGIDPQDHLANPLRTVIERDDLRRMGVTLQKLPANYQRIFAQRINDTNRKRFLCEMGYGDEWYRKVDQRCRAKLKEAIAA